MFFFFKNNRYDHEQESQAIEMFNISKNIYSYKAIYFVKIVKSFNTNSKQLLTLS